MQARGPSDEGAVPPLITSNGDPFLQMRSVARQEGRRKGKRKGWGMDYINLKLKHQVK